VTDRQTDGQTSYDSIVRAMHSIARQRWRNKKYTEPNGGLNRFYRKSSVFTQSQACDRQTDGKAVSTTEHLLNETLLTNRWSKLIARRLSASALNDRRVDG